MDGDSDDGDGDDDDGDDGNGDDHERPRRGLRLREASWQPRLWRPPHSDGAGTLRPGEGEEEEEDEEEEDKEEEEELKRGKEGWRVGGITMAKGHEGK